MYNSTNVDYQNVKSLIKEGDVVLFRGKTIASWFIKKAGAGEYTHVGLASWHKGQLELVEFKEGNPIGLLFGGDLGIGGGRTVSLDTQVKKYSGLVDIYRFIPSYNFMYYDTLLNKVLQVQRKFKGECLTRTLRSMTGLPYGWKTIWEFLKYNMFGLRLIYNTSRQLIDDNFISQNYPVCSTAVANVSKQCYIDLVPNRSDITTQPNDIARSSALKYLFTLNWREQV